MPWGQSCDPPDDRPGVCGGQDQRSDHHTVAAGRGQQFQSVLADCAFDEDDRLGCGLVVKSASVDQCAHPSRDSLV